MGVTFGSGMLGDIAAMKKYVLTIEIIADGSELDSDVLDAIEDFRGRKMAKSIADCDGVLWVRSKVEEMDGEGNG